MTDTAGKVSSFFVDFLRNFDELSLPLNDPNLLLDDERDDHRMRLFDERRLDRLRLLDDWLFENLASLQVTRGLDPKYLSSCHE